jgi:nicotinamide-nucleotide amidase
MLSISGLCIGDELLDGRIRDENGPALGRMVAELDARLESVRFVRDERDAIVDSLDRAAEQSDVIVVSGGLGPTADDITRDAAAHWFGEELVVDEELLETLKSYFEASGFEFTQNNRHQCMFPKSADIFRSDVGTAPGFRLERDDAEVYFFPGVPSEYEWYLESIVRPRLAECTGDSQRVRRTLTFLGPGESTLESELADVVERGEQRDVHFSYLAGMPLVSMRVDGPDVETVDDVQAEVEARWGDAIVTRDRQSLPERVGELLESRGETVATAESCTAGGLASRITEVSGSSAWFEYGMVTYANEAKLRMLDVREATLEQHGAVSPETVREMASGARAYAEAEWSLAISGIAGPTGGTDEKPVGTVDFGLGTPEGVYHRRVTFPPRSREFVRHASVQTAMSALVWRLEERLEPHDFDGPIDV